MAGRLNRSDGFGLDMRGFVRVGAPSLGGYDYIVQGREIQASGLMLLELNAWRQKPQWQHSAIMSQISGMGRNALSDIVLNQDNYAQTLYIQAPAFGDGWSHFAQDLADEAGLYEEDALGKIGYYEQAFEQAIMVVMDTGIHHLGWSREQAIVKLVWHLGVTTEVSASLIDFIVACPAKIISGFYGRSRWQSFRAASRQRLGARFDQKRFLSEGLASGPLSMDHIELIYKNEKMI